MLVADALDIVATIAVPVHGWTLYWLQTNDFVSGPPLLQAVARGDGTTRTHGRDVGGNPTIANSLLLEFLGQFHNCIAGDIVVKAVVAHDLELVQNTDALRILGLQFLGLVVDLLDVGFAAGSEDQASPIAPHQFETLDAHLLRKDDDGIEVHPASHPGSPDAVVPGRRPYQRVNRGIHFAIQLLLDEHRIGGAHLVAAGGEILAVEHDDGGVHVGQLSRQDVVVRPVLVVPPGDVIQIDRIERVLLHHLTCPCPHLRINLPRMEHLLESGTDNQFVRLAHHDDSFSVTR